MNEKFERISIDEIVFSADVQGAASRLSIPKVVCEFFDWQFNDAIWLKVERRGQVFQGDFAMSSGYEIVPGKGDDQLKKVLLPGARVRVTVKR